jgi:hypothetical protein
MAKFMVGSEYYDGKDVSYRYIGLVRTSDLDEFVPYLLRCGYEGRMEGKRGRFSATIDPGVFNHHGNHIETICIDRIKDLRAMTPEEWKGGIKSIIDAGFSKNGDGVYVREDDFVEDDDFWDDDSHESDSDDEIGQAEDELSFGAILKDYLEGR